MANLARVALAKYRAMSLPVKAGTWFTVCTVIQRGISIISMPVFTRLLTTGEFGQYNLYVSWYMIFTLIVTLNLYSEVFNKGLSDHSENRDKFTTSQAGLLTVLAVGFAMVYLVFSSFINTVTGMSTPLTLLAFAELYTGGIIAFWSARKRFEYNYKAILVVVPGSTLLGVILGVVFVLLAPDGLKVEGRVLGTVVSYAVFAMPMIFSFVRKSRCFYERCWWKTSLALCIPLVPHYLSQVFLNQSDKVMIGWFCNDTSVAIYSVAHSAGLLLVMVNNGISQAFVPWLYEKLRGKDYELIGPTVNPFCAVVLCLNCMLVILAPEAVLVLSTIDYIDAIWCIAPIATSVVFAFIYTMFVNVEIYYGETGFVAIASVLSAALNIVLNLLLIPTFGYIAAAYTTSFSYLVTAILHFFLMRKALQQNGAPVVFDIKFMVVCCIATCMFSALAMALYRSFIIRIILVAGGCLSAYLLRLRIRSALSALKKTTKNDTESD